MSNAPEDDAVTETDARQASDATAVSAEAGEVVIETDGDLVAVDDGESGAQPELTLVEALEAKVATLEQEKKDTYERLLRATADLDNFRKRSRREVDDAKVEARARVFRDILPVLDNMERALAHAETATDDGGSSIIDGVKLVMRQFAQALEKSEVKAIDAEGKPFDPNLHEAMSQIESAEHPAGTVMQVLQAGYTIGARLLRPALVVVAKAPSVHEPAAGANGKSHATESTDAAGEDDGDGETP